MLWLPGSWYEWDIVYARVLTSSDGRGALHVFQFVALEIAPTAVADIGRLALIVGPRLVRHVPAAIHAGEFASRQAEQRS